ncbi:MAG: neprosin family prolyl endopeptidase [Acidobacteriaceae bacterium]|nr:neprosin family prolyl endopeptidase [Acidobacteriaceae bacterium]MBV9779332.1 neprosin family prolyl endopeptidase [Acidobacteriaceae bacterium]
MKYSIPLFGFMLAVAGFNAPINAQANVTSFVPFDDFLQSAKLAIAGDYLSRSGNRVRDEQAFEEMRQHILTMYEGVTVTHSFVLDDSHFDCIPIEQQPTVRILGLKGIATPPPDSMLPKAQADSNAAEGIAKPASQLDPDEPFDRFGNSVACEENTIPMRRITLDDMTRFQTLQQFFEKGPNGAGQAVETNGLEPPAAESHKYSFTYQNVKNWGGNSNLNLWSPHVNTSKGEVFSLSQEWYIGGNQTAEVGWQNYPDFYGGQNSRLFIYWTADGYHKTGCYNLTCAAFVQVANHGDLGAGFTHYSKQGGTQWEFAAEYYLYKGNWWLAIQGKWIGYYPGSIYRHGQLSKHAQTIEFGTEGVAKDPWPPEGSGQWPYRGFGYAAFQRNLFYINSSSNGIWDSLTRVRPSPKCYSIRGPYSSGGSGWEVYFYEGGPGGSGC